MSAASPRSQPPSRLVVFGHFDLSQDRLGGRCGCGELLLLERGHVDNFAVGALQFRLEEVEVQAEHDDADERDEEDGEQYQYGRSGEPRPGRSGHDGHVVVVVHAVHAHAHSGIGVHSWLLKALPPAACAVRSEPSW